MSNLPESFSQPLQQRHQGNDLTLQDLWLRCMALGGMNTPRQLAAFLRGELRPTRREYNLVAVALNEYLTDIGMWQFVPYIEDETTVPLPLMAAWSRSG
jgi:hypothetical protein